MVNAIARTLEEYVNIETTQTSSISKRPYLLHSRIDQRRASVLACERYGGATHANLPRSTIDRRIPPLFGCLPTERTAAGALPATKGEAGDPDNREHDGRNPQQVNGKSCTKKNQHQKSQQDYEHNVPLSWVPGLDTLSIPVPADGRYDLHKVIPVRTWAKRSCSQVAENEYLVIPVGINGAVQSLLAQRCRRELTHRSATARRWMSKRLRVVRGCTRG